jgi:hypothetical protein
MCGPVWWFKVVVLLGMRALEATSHFFVGILRCCVAGLAAVVLVKHYLPKSELSMSVCAGVALT